MKQLPFPRDARAPRIALFSTCVVLLIGCQSYEPVTLDLKAHEDELAARLVTDESLLDFAQRLNDSDRVGIDAFDPNDGLNWAEAEVIALFYNPELRLARLRAGVTLATAQNAGLWEDPVFGFDGTELLSPGGPFEFGLITSLTIPVSGRLQVEKDRADAAYAEQLHRIVDAEWQMRSQVRKAWASWSVASQRVALLEQVAEALSRLSVVSDRLEQAGELTRVESRLLRSQRLAIRVEAVGAEALAQQARLELIGLMRLSPNASLTLVPGLPTVDSPDAPDISERLIRANTSLAVLRAEYAVAEQALRLEVRKQYPDIKIGAGYGSQDNDDRLLLGASLSIPLINANRGGIAEARANRALARATAETGFEGILLRLEAARARQRAADQQQQVMRQELIPMLDEQAKELDRLAELGEVNTLILLETVTRQYQAKSRILELHLDAIHAQIDIAELLGPDDALEPAPVFENTNTKPTTTGGDDAAQGVSP